MLSDIKWFGIDFAFTIMNPLTMHHSLAIPRMYRLLGRSTEGPERLARWYRLRDSVGSPGDPPHQKVRLLKEFNRDRIYAEVFSNDPDAIKLYSEMEARERRPTEGLKEALDRLKKEGKSLSVVSEVSGVEGTLTITASLNAHDLIGIFSEIITPAGRFTPAGELLDGTTFKGTSKKDGSIYERLADYLDSRGILANQRATVGDDPKVDIEPARKYGFVTIQYSGVIDRGGTDKADYTLTHWSELRRIL